MNSRAANFCLLFSGKQDIRGSKKYILHTFWPNFIAVIIIIIISKITSSPKVRDFGPHLSPHETSRNMKRFLPTLNVIISAAVFGGVILA